MQLLAPVKVAQGMASIYPRCVFSFCTLNKEQQFSPNHGGSRRLALETVARTHEGAELSTQAVASLEPLGRCTYHQQLRALHAQPNWLQKRAQLSHLEISAVTFSKLYKLCGRCTRCGPRQDS